MNNKPDKITKKSVKGRNNGTLNPGYYGQKNGRPRKFVTTLKMEGYKLSEINDTIQVMLSMTIEELKAVFENKESTIMEKTIANALRKSLEKGNLDSIETLLNRTYGKLKESIDQKTQETEIIVRFEKDDNNQI